MSARLGVALLLMAVIVLVTFRYRTTRRDRSAPDGLVNMPPVPSELVAGADRTWVLFTTPYCASCGPVEAQLRSADPGARVVKVDATSDVALARSFAVRTAPTVLLADRAGAVHARLTGARALGRYLAELVDS